MASLFKQGGLFYGQFYSILRTPQRKRVPLKTKRQDEARRRLASLEQRFRDGAFDPWRDDPWRRDGNGKQHTAESDSVSSEKPPLLLGEAVEDYLAACAHLRPVTVKTYRDILDPFCRCIGPQTELRELGPDDIRRWFDSTKAGDVTRVKYLNHLGYFLRHFAREGQLDTDPSKSVKLPKLPEQAPKSMSPEMVASFIATANKWPGYDYSWIADLVEANVEMGLRRGELLALRPEHVDLDRKLVRVVNTEAFTTKSGKERAVPLSSTAKRVLRKRQDLGGPCIFGPSSGSISPNGLSHAFNRVRKEAGLPAWVNLHSTRHTALTRLAEAGVPIEVIRQFAGHSSITVTERYTRLRPDTVMSYVLRALG